MWTSKLPRLKQRTLVSLCLIFLAIVIWWGGVTALTAQSAIRRDNTFSYPVVLHPISQTALTQIANQGTELYANWVLTFEQQRSELRSARRQARIDKVEAFFTRYGARLSGYAPIIVDQAEACGGDYRILVGIAGSESGLGRVMYKRYNPYGYLNGVQYNSLEEALTFLSCQVSQQHIARCGDDLNCLARRYAGPQDDKQHFINKVRWFAQQVS